MNGERTQRLLDTSAIVKLMRANLAIPSGSCVSLITLAELRAGALKSRDPEQELQRIETTLAGARVLVPSARTIVVYSDVWLELEIKGCRIKTNDLWNAALAIEHDVELHADDQYFSQITKLKYVKI